MKLQETVGYLAIMTLSPMYKL